MTADKASVVWLCGLSGAGKTTIATLASAELTTAGVDVQVLDGDVMRQTICRGLTFSRPDRVENLRRIAWLAEFLAQHGVTVIVAAITPYQEAHDAKRDIITAPLLTAYCDASLAVCERRDTRGLYAKARSGELVMFTGIHDPFDAPAEPGMVCHTAEETPDESAAKVVEWVSATRARL